MASVDQGAIERSHKARERAQEYRACENCVFFNHLHNECRRRAPILSQRQDLQFPELARWPEVELDDCCGEWEARSRGLRMSGREADFK